MNRMRAAARPGAERPAEIQPLATDHTAEEGENAAHYGADENVRHSSPILAPHPDGVPLLAPVYPPAEQDGYAAGARGERAAANPHAPGSAEAEAWARGRARWEAFVAHERELWEASVAAYGRGAPRRRRRAA